MSKQIVPLFVQTKHSNAMEKRDIFSELHILMEEPIPDSVIIILKCTGFEQKITLRALNAKSITEIEEFICENSSILSELPTNSIYHRIKPFKFLPGHRVLIESIPKYMQDPRKEHECDEPESRFSTPSYFSTILKSLIENSQNNKTRNIKSLRYSDIIQAFSTYVYLMAGRACYDTLSANLPIPKSTTILSYIHKRKQKIIEGELRCQELSKYLEELNVNKCVWLCEDATGINVKVEYDPITNQLVGLVLPINLKTGLPESFTFIAKSAEDIQRMITSPKSTHVYVVLAQPLKEHVPPFVLQIFGTDNRFKGQNVVQRWDHTIDELKKHGIIVAGFSSDGDSRLLNSMLYKMKFGDLESSDFPFDRSISYIQDYVHIGTKLRNRLLKPSIELPIGNKLITVSHLKILINDVDKDIHGLCLSDICPDDRQNYGSLEKIMKPSTLQALAKYVSGTEGTIMFLNICSEITSSFSDENLSPLDRVYRIWHSNFFIRAWRKSIQNMSNSLGNRKQSNFTLAENFITRNAYVCVELNAHNLISAMRYFRDIGMPELFITVLLSSQPCEELFRQMRSMGTMNYTKINFSLLELFHLISRVELQNHIVYFQLSNMGVSFPRNKVKKLCFDRSDLPSDDEIKSTIGAARISALKDAQRFGMKVRSDEIDRCYIGNIDVFKNTSRNVNLDINDHLIGSDKETGEDDLEEECGSVEYFNPRPGTLQNVENNPSASLEVDTCDGEKKTIKKSTFLWLLNESTGHLSKDRLKRVQDASRFNSSCRRRLRFSKEISNTTSIKYECEIKIGDWVIFTDNRKSTLGHVICFKYIKGKNEKQKQYSWDFAPVTVDENKENKRGINVLAEWYLMREHDKLSTIDSKNSSFKNIENYVATFKNPIFNYDNDTKEIISIEQSCLKVVESELIRLKI